MAQPTFETVTTNAGAGGDTFLVETVGSDLVPASLLCYSTGDGTVEAVTDSGTEGLPVRINSGTVTSVTAVQNVVQLGGAAVSMGTGVRDAGTQRVTIATNDVVPISDNGGSITVDNAGTFAVQSTIVGQSGALTVTGTVTVINGGTFATQIDGDALIALQLIDNIVSTDDAAAGTAGVGLMGIVNPTNALADADDLAFVRMGTTREIWVDAGRVGHDSTDSGSPVKLGGHANDEDRAAVADADRVDAYFDTHGRLIIGKAPKEELLDGTASATDTSDTEVIAAQGAGFRIWITAVIISNESSNNAAVLIKSATTTRLRFPAPANSGAVINLDPPVRLGDNEALNFASSTSVSTMHVSAVGFKAR